MAKYLIDANLPYRLRLWYSEDYEHQIDLDSQAADADIWRYARQHDMTIITKDADFSQRMLLSSPPPRVIHIKVGNLKLRDFYAFLFKVWDETLALSKHNKLVNVYLDRIEAIE